MAIILYFLVGIASIVASIISFSLGVEWWAGLIILLLGIGAIIVALYKLDEETQFFTDYLKNKKKQRADKIYNNEFKTERLNMVEMLIKAYDERKAYGKEHVEKKAYGGIMRLYNELQKNWTLVAQENAEYRKECDENEVKRRIFSAIETAIIIMVGCDDSLGDYGFYEKYYKAASVGINAVTPLKRSEFLSTYRDMMKNGGNRTVLGQIAFLRCGGRRSVSSRIYTEFVQAIGYLMLLDGTVHENEYILYSCFFDEGDVYPATWERFKSEYK